MKKIKSIFLGITLMLIPLLGNAQTLAFPTAEGFGKYATGGRGGKVVSVTTLEDDSLGNVVGSLRWAVMQYPNEPITVVFKVSGIINLKRDLKIARTGFTLAGQTAPGDGICISKHKVNLGGSKNFIIRHLRFRIGQYDVNGNIIAENSFGAENCENFIIDHCTFGWSVEENMNTFDDQFHTVQWCIIHEGLYDAGHSKGPRGYGMQWGGSQATYHHNLLAHNRSRSCRFNGSRGGMVGQDLIVFIEYINNVNYNWGSEGACYGGENSSDNRRYFGHEANFLNNYYKPGPATSSRHYFFQQDLARTGATSHGPSQWHFDGNIMHGNQAVTEDNWLGFKNNTSYSIDEFKVDTIIQPVNYVPMYAYEWETYTYKNYQPAIEAYKSVLDSAGAFPRDVIDERIVEEVNDGTAQYGNKGIINTPDEAEGFPEYKTYNTITDNDEDGIDDEWEIINGLDPNDPEDRNLLTKEGYTALEVYLNSLVGEEIEPDFVTNIRKNSLVNLHISPNPVKDMIEIHSDSELLSVNIYSIDGICLLSENIINNNCISVNSLPNGTYLLRVIDKDGGIGRIKFIKE